MKSLTFFLIIALVPLCTIAQILEVDGPVKITEMDTVNTENLLVVKQSDGTLATRQIASLPPPPGDTTRTLQSDLLLMAALCNCTNLPPAMIQSLLDNGYTLEDLLGFETSTTDLLGAGVYVDDLLSAGETPLDIYNAGAPADSLYGKIYQGGYIFYLDTLDIHPSFEGLVAALSDQGSGAEWGCYGTLIGGTSSGIGKGQENTDSIVSGCLTAGIAALLCQDLDANGYDDWFLPSKNELDLMWENLADSDGDGNNSGPSDPGNLGNFANSAYYWSSTESNNTNAWAQHFSTGLQASTGNKSYPYRVRAVRTF